MRCSLLLVTAALFLRPHALEAETTPPPAVKAPRAASSGKLPSLPAPAPSTTGTTSAPAPSAGTPVGSAAVPPALAPSSGVVATATPPPVKAPAETLTSEQAPVNTTPQRQAEPPKPEREPPPLARQGYAEPPQRETTRALDGFGEAPTAFNEPWRLVLSLEHLVGIFGQTITAKPEAQEESEDSLFRVGLLGGSSGQYSSPQLGLDVFVNHLFTFGSAISYHNSSVDPAENDESSSSGFSISPRVGVAFGKDRLLGWVRGGVAISSETRNVQRTFGEAFELNTFSQALTLEALMMILHGESHFGFSIGPAVYLPLGASQSSDGEEVKDTELGVSTWMVTLSGHFGF